MLRLSRWFVLVLACAVCVSCAGAMPSYAPWKGIADVAPEPMTPLAVPMQRMRGEKGSAPLNYPPDFAASVSPDGTIAFPDNTVGKIEGNEIHAAGAVVATLSPSGEVAGSGLSKKYQFNENGELLDADGHGVRMSPEGGVRGIGGKWKFKDVMTWAPEGEKWNYSGWRALTIISLIMVENLTPEALHESSGGSAPVAASSGVLPLTGPTQAIRGEKGNAPATYPASFGATIKADGSVAFPDNTAGKIKKDGVYAGGSPLATVSETGEVSGSALKHKYKFGDRGELVDAEGHGVRVSPDGSVRGLGGKWRYKTVMVWSADGGKWDYSGWHAVAIVSLIVIENMVPDAIR